MAISHVAVKRLVEEPAFCEDLENRWHTTAQQQPLDLLNRCKALNSYLRKVSISTVQVASSCDYKEASPTRLRTGVPVR